MSDKKKRNFLLPVIILLLFLGILATGHFLFGLAVLVIGIAVVVPGYIQRRKPPEPGE